jgi:alpha-tubulin suppressor-like RCC1 family protein
VLSRVAVAFGVVVLGACAVSFADYQLDGSGNGGAGGDGGSGNFTTTGPPDGGAGGLRDVCTENGDGFRQVSVGTNHSCAVHCDGTVMCWGSNERGQLGIETGGAGGGDTSGMGPVPVEGVIGAESISAGFEHTCVVTTNHDVFCWGDDRFHQTSAGLGGPVTAHALGFTDAVAIAAGGKHTCMLHGDGTVSCWGDNSRCQIGSGSCGDAVLGVTLVASLTGASALALGDLHTCARADDEIACWGDNQVVQAGTPGETMIASPTVIRGMTAAGVLDAGRNQSCAVVMSPDPIWCWGEQNGPDILQLGATEPGVLSLGVGDGFVCAVFNDRTLCTKTNPQTSDLVLGRPEGMADVQVPGELHLVQVASGKEHSCGITTAGTVVCWGVNASYRLGVSGHEPLPIEVPL